MTSNEPKPVSIGHAFPPGNAAGEWVLVLAMAMNDLATLDTQVHEALDHDRPESGYFIRLLCGALREVWKLFDVADKSKPVAELLDGLRSETRSAYEDIRLLFVRPPITELDPKPKSWAELYLRDVRNRTFHYPRVGGADLPVAVRAVSTEQARLRAAHKGSSRPFEFADVVAIQAAFGDINQRQERKRLGEILTTSKKILNQFVPVVWDALGVHLRAQGIDPRRLEAPETDEPIAE